MANAVVNKILDFLGVDNGEAIEDEELLDNEYADIYEDEEELPVEEEKEDYSIQENLVKLLI